MRLISLLPCRDLADGQRDRAFLHLFPSKIRSAARVNIGLCFPELGRKGSSGWSGGTFAGSAYRCSVMVLPGGRRPPGSAA